MILTKLELQGFKSFATKTVLEFNKGITAIVGPNGSGKSNIADAIRWVLGTQSSKQLRGMNMGDMIFSGTQYRKPIGFAEASLYFDNSGRFLNIDFDQVKVTRRVYRSGESDYSVNDKTVRLKDIQTLFFDTGVGKEGYSIVGQHEVNNIIESNSLERRGIFEEAAGIMKYKQKKLESLRKLNSTEENLIRIGDIITEIENQLEPLKKQSDKAKEYLRVYEILRTNEVGLYLNNLEMFESRIKKYQDDIGQLSQDIALKEEELEAIKEENKSNLQKIEDFENKENELKEELNSFLRNLESIRHEILLYKERLSNAKDEIKKNQDNIEDFKLREEELSKDYITKENAGHYLEKQVSNFKEKLEVLEKESDEIIKSLSETEKVTESLKAAIMKDLEDISSVKLEINDKVNKQRALEERLDNLDSNINKVIYENDSLLLSKQTKQEENLKLKKSKEEDVQKRDQLKTDYQKIQAQLTSLRDKEQKLKTNIEISQSNHNLIEDMEKHMQGYRNDVKAVMENKSLTGVVDVVAKIFSTKEIYNRAIESAMGGNIQNVVVEDEQAAKEAIEFLKSKNLGRVTFLPLNTVRPSYFNDNEVREIMSLNGVVDVAYKLLEYEGIFDNIAKYLLGKIIVVDTYDNAVAIARKTSHRYKLVTLTGEFFNTGGSITGGSQHAGKIGLLGRQKQLENLKITIKKLSVEQEEVSKEMKDHYSRLNTMAANIDKLDLDIREKDIQITKAESEILSLDKSYKQNQESLKSSKESKLLIKEEIKGFDDLIKAQNEILLGIEKAYEQKRQDLDLHELANKEKSSKRDNIYLDISNLKVSVGSIEESMKNNEEALIRIGFEKEALVVKRKETIKRNLELEEVVADLNKVILEKSTLVNKPDDIRLKFEKEIEKIRADRRKLSDENENFIQRVTDENKDIMLLQNKISSLEVSKGKTEIEIEAMKNRMWDEYNLTHNDALERHGEIENIGEARKQIVYAKSVIKQLGPVNLDSIEDYAKSNERYRFFTSQRDDIEKSKEDLYKTVNEMNTVMRKQFREKFAIISENFNEIFVKLFDGGQARLQLTDETDILECGIDIIVQPPGKKLQNMMLLSGGEKAFTAIALIFSMLKLNPSPFCVFDEIDTSLDDNNVMKYCKYLNNHKLQTQFVLITHRKGTMENADSIYGVTMQEHGITKVVSMQLTD